MTEKFRALQNYFGLQKNARPAPSRPSANKKAGMKPAFRVSCQAAIST